MKSNIKTVLGIKEDQQFPTSLQSLEKIIGETRVTTEDGKKEPMTVGLFRKALIQIMEHDPVAQKRESLLMQVDWTSCPLSQGRQ
ncbi:MAG: hypothetical protein ACKO43_05690 [Alphaproteobacteria bacterium]